MQRMRWAICHLSDDAVPLIYHSVRLTELKMKCKTTSRSLFLLGISKIQELTNIYTHAPLNATPGLRVDLGHMKYFNDLVLIAWIIFFVSHAHKVFSCFFKLKGR